MEQHDPEIPSTAPDAAASRESPVLRGHAERLLRVVQPVVGLARSFMSFFLVVGLLAVLGGTVLLLVLFGAVGFEGTWRMLLALLMAVMLLSPGAVLLLFWVGLRQLVAIPEDLVESVGSLEVRSSDAIAASRQSWEGKGRVGRMTVLLRALVDVRSAVLENRDVFAKGLVLVRMANPVSLVIVLAATLASLLIVAVSVVVAAAAAL